MGLSFEKAFAEVKKITGEVLKGVVVQEVSKIPAVQKEIEKQKTESGKSFLWVAFPFVIIFGLVFFLLKGK